MPIIGNPRLEFQARTKRSGRFGHANQHVFGTIAEEQAIAELQRSALLNTYASESRTCGAELGLSQDQRAMRARSQGARGQPHRGEPSACGLSLIIRLPSKKQPAVSSQFLVV